MILSETFWPLFAAASFLRDTVTPEWKGHKQELFPGHTLMKLNDGNVIPSPAWGTGTGTVEHTNATQYVLRALENGWRHIDTSLSYKNQVGTGIAIKMSGIPREELYITSKYDAIDGVDVAHEIYTTLKQLDIDYLDCYIIHSTAVPARAGGIKKVWPQMEQLVRDGLVKSIGVSNWNTVELLDELYSIAKILPAINQIDYSVYNAVELQPVLARGYQHGLLFSAYGEMRPITRSPGGPADKVGEKIAHRLGKTLGSEVTYSQTILDWLRSTGVLAVTTTSNEQRLKEQLKPFAKDFPLLTAEEVREFELSGYGFEA